MRKKPDILGEIIGKLSFISVKIVFSIQGSRKTHSCLLILFPSEKHLVTGHTRTEFKDGDGSDISSSTVS